MKNHWQIVHLLWSRWIPRTIFIGAVIFLGLYYPDLLPVILWGIGLGLLFLLAGKVSRWLKKKAQEQSREIEHWPTPRTCPEGRATYCQAVMHDEEHCAFARCPQKRDHEPEKSGRRCPLDADLIPSEVAWIINERKPRP